jgi:integrase
MLLRFFKWLYYPDDTLRARKIPAVVQKIPMLKRKEQSIYKPTDLWTVEDDLLFLKYCLNKRDRCYHAVSRDTSCRPHEILNLRIKDVVFKTLEIINMQKSLLMVRPEAEASPYSIRCHL